jgi:hypothetical protein
MAFDNFTHTGSAIPWSIWMKFNAADNLKYLIKCTNYNDIDRFRGYGSEVGCSRAIEYFP